MKRFLLVIVTAIFMVGNLQANSIDEKSFYKKHSSFGYTRLAFIDEFNKNPSNWRKLVKKHLKDYEEDCRSSISKEEEAFMKHELMTIVNHHFGWPDPIEEAKKAEEAALAKQKAEEKALICKQQKEKLLQEAKDTYPYLKNKSVIDGFVGNFASVEATIIYCGNLRTNKEITDVYEIPPSGGKKETDASIIPPALVNVHKYANQLPGLCVREDNNEFWCETDFKTMNELNKMLKSDANKTTIKFLKGNYMGVGTIGPNGYQPIK